MLSQVVFLQNYAPGSVTTTHGPSPSKNIFTTFCSALCLNSSDAAGQWDCRRTRGSLQWLPWIVLALAGLVILLRAVTNACFAYDIKTHHMATHLRIDSLLFGVLIGYWYHFHRLQLVEFVGVDARCC